MGVIRRDTMWPSPVVPFEIDFPDPSSERNEILQAINHWNDNTHYRFVPRDGEQHYMSLESASGSCSTFVGFSGGKHVIGCDVADTGFGPASVIHEIGHAVGLYHEQSRADRDDHIDIDFDNIQSGRAHNFDKHDDAKMVGAYDYLSRMHYHAFAFADDTSKPTITCKPNPCPSNMGSTSGLSATDIRTIHFMRWLDGASDGTTAQLVDGRSHGTRWRVTEQDGYTYLQCMNNNFHAPGTERWLDGASDGSTVQLVDGQSHGTRWKLVNDGGYTYVRSMNNNFQAPGTERWLDGASDGTTAQLVDGQSHGTRWNLIEHGGFTYLRCMNNNFI